MSRYFLECEDGIDEEKWERLMVGRPTRKPTDSSVLKSLTFSRELSGPVQALVRLASITVEQDGERVVLMRAEVRQLAEALGFKISDPSAWEERR